MRLTHGHYMSHVLRSMCPHCNIRIDCSTYFHFSLTVPSLQTPALGVFQFSLCALLSVVPRPLKTSNLTHKVVVSPYIQLFIPYDNPQTFPFINSLHSFLSCTVLPAYPASKSLFFFSNIISLNQSIPFAMRAHFYTF